MGSQGVQGIVVEQVSVSSAASRESEISMPDAEDRHSRRRMLAIINEPNIEFDAFDPWSWVAIVLQAFARGSAVIGLSLLSCADRIKAYRERRKDR